MSNNQVNQEYGNAHAGKSGTRAESERRERVIIERMKNLTEEQIIHALYVEASVLVQLDINEENGKANFSAKSGSLQGEEK